MELREGKNYGDFAVFIYRLAELLDKGYSVDGLYKAYHDYELGLISRKEIHYTEEISTKAINKVRKAFCSATSDTKVNELINAANVFAAENGKNPVTSYDDLKAIIKYIFNEWKALKAIHTVEYDNVALKVMNKALEDKRKALEQDV